ncbi:MAG TPA: helix-turn-helix transcriptional regulator [Candidatus Hydrogenedentes bacterium]|nr:helix-turn-helix transcriptional regulator [Candidatus Hydrogenedentota bacterium]HQH51108.1 helix-turn-helix transcriptional regulator [Candidatus Hydrogenedentota bacterium]HQM47393.1 helix-turn-helix transcriptional regulator [Candidatus Hydrogenedentota bacterium]
MSSKVTFPGDELRERREARGLTLTETYKRVHIPIRYIEALEQSNFEELPEPCFVKGFLKSYCAFLDLNAERFINLYHESVEPAPIRILRNTAKEPMAAQNWRTELLTWAAICAILAVGWFTYQIVVRPDAGASKERVEAGTPDVNERPLPQGNPFEPEAGRDSGL